MTAVVQSTDRAWSSVSPRPTEGSLALGQDEITKLQLAAGAWGFTARPRRPCLTLTPRSVGDWQVGFEGMSGGAAAAAQGEQRGESQQSGTGGLRDKDEIDLSRSGGVDRESP